MSAEFPEAEQAPDRTKDQAAQAALASAARTLPTASLSRQPLKVSGNFEGKLRVQSRLERGCCCFNAKDACAVAGDGIHD